MQNGVDPTHQPTRMHHDPGFALIQTHFQKDHLPLRDQATINATTRPTFSKHRKLSVKPCRTTVRPEAF